MKRLTILCVAIMMVASGCVAAGGVSKGVPAPAEHECDHDMEGGHHDNCPIHGGGEAAPDGNVPACGMPDCPMGDECDGSCSHEGGVQLDQGGNPLTNI